MQALLNSSSQRLAQPKTDKSYSKLSMISRHTCPCCSYILLRHLRWGGIYWRCSHCYQEMPAF